MTQSEVGTDEQIGRPLSKLVAHGDAAQAIVRATVHRDGAPVSGATLEFSRSIAGQAPDYHWSGTTDDHGHAWVEIKSGNGYYQARASQDGVVIGSWRTPGLGDCGTGRINIYHHTDLNITDPAQLPIVYRFTP